jgi:hypothetical protein
VAYSYTSAKPYTPPKVPGQAVQNDLLKALSTNAGQSVQATIPYDEYGDNTSAPKHVGQMPATYQPPAAPATTSTSSGGGGGGGGGQQSFDFSGDPILARIRALNAQNISQAEASALAQRKRAEIGYGYDPTLTYEDAATQEAARQNPFSALAQLLFGHTQRAGNLDESLNKSNLFYSGERAKQVGLEGRQYTLEQTNQQSQFQNTMDAIAQAVLQARMQAQQQETQAESDAYGRSINNALQYGGYGDSGGGGAQQSWNGIGLASGANSFAGAGQQEAPNQQTVSIQNQLDTSGGWGVQWSGPGTYVAYKFPGGPGQGSDTRWVKVG